jgi:hypothetical protein
MKYFCVLYMAPVAELDKWMKTPEKERNTVEATMRAEWNLWLKAHANNVKNTIGLGQAKRVDANGISDSKNGIMLSSYVEAESSEAAAKLFTDHPHLKIPGATIDIMETTPLS